MFHERVPLPARARHRMQLSDAWRFGMLAESAEAWSFRMMQDRATYFDRGDTARMWFDEEYAPVVEMLIEADMVGDRTETDAYLDVATRATSSCARTTGTREVLARVRGERPRSRRGERGEPV